MNVPIAQEPAFSWKATNPSPRINQSQARKKQRRKNKNLIRKYQPKNEAASIIADRLEKDFVECLADVSGAKDLECQSRQNCL